MSGRKAGASLPPATMHGDVELDNVVVGDGAGALDLRRHRLPACVLFGVVTEY